MPLEEAIQAELEDLLAPLRASDQGVGAAEGPEQLTKVQDALSVATDPADGLAWLADRITTLEPTAGTWVAVYLGGLVERGRLEANVSSAGVLAFFRTALTALHADPEHAEWHECAGLIGPAVITHLSANPDALDGLRSDDALVDQIRGLASAYEPCLYIDGLIRQQSGQVVLLDAPGKRGLLISYGNLGTIGHLITLVQSILPMAWSQGRTQLPQMLAVAWGENPLNDETPGDEAWFDYRDADPLATVDSLPAIGGHRVLSVSPEVIGEAAWSADAFGPQLSLTRPSISLDRDLAHSEVITLVGQIRNQ